MEDMKAFNCLCGLLKSILTITLLNTTYSQAQYINPLKGDIGIHDPSILVKQGSNYYLYSTGNLIQVKTSADKITWKDRGSLFSSGFSWVKTEVPANNGTDFWAPDIIFRNDQYWMYYTISTFGSNSSAIALATNPTLDMSSPIYKWTDRGVVIKSTASNDYNCIDPNTFQDTDGKLWIVFGSFWSGIKLAQLDTSSGKPQSSTPTTSIASRTSSDLGIESPFLLKWNNYYYLFVSWDLCCKGVNSTYKIVVGRASTVSGPYMDKSNKSMISGGGTILDAGDSRWKGPGGQSIFIENDNVYCVNHAYDANNNGTPTLMIRPLYWVNDWPTFIKPSSISYTSKTALNISTLKPTKPHLIFKSSDSKAENYKRMELYSITGTRMSNSFLKSCSGIFIVNPE